MTAFALPPLAELTPAKAAIEFAQARYMLSKLEPDQQLPGFARITTRFARAQLAGLLPDERIADRVWEAAEVTGLIDKHGFDTLQNVLVAALETAEQHPARQRGPRTTCGLPLTSGKTRQPFPGATGSMDTS